jgi:hypothetical protein
MRLNTSRTRMSAKALEGSIPASPRRPTKVASLGPMPPNEIGRRATRIAIGTTAMRIPASISMPSAQAPMMKLMVRRSWLVMPRRKDQPSVQGKRA